jgi:hypothetical protein
MSNALHSVAQHNLVPTRHSVSVGPGMSLTEVYVKSSVLLCRRRPRGDEEHENQGVAQATTSGNGRLAIDMQNSWKYQ